jgi:ribonuclease-3
VVPKKSCKQPNIKRKMSLPPLPPVQSEAALAIFVHSSLKSLVQNDNFGDADRLAFIGRHALSMAIAEVLSEKKPMIGALELEV